MPIPTPPRSSPSPSPRSALTQIEALYNTAVQAFVRREHVKSLSTLRRLLETLSTHPPPTGVWHDLTSPLPSVAEREVGEWREKVLKLYISSGVSFYSDPKDPKGLTSASSEGLPVDLAELVPPSTPDLLLEHLQRTAESHALPQPLPSPALLPPSLVSTLLLASLKLQPTPPALDYAHRLAEEWLAGLPDELLLAISRTGGGGVGEGTVPGAGAEQKKRVESLREGYLKVTELFVGEVLVKEGEWEMARAFLEGEEVMGSKRKENLYRHIRSAESRPRGHSSPSSSTTLPSPSSSGILPSSSTSSSRTGRSRASSASSSSSEATARPHTTTPTSHLTVAPRRSARGRDRLLDRKLSSSRHGNTKQSDEADDEKEAVASHSTESSLPSKLYINHSPASSSRVPFRPRATPPPGSNLRRANGMGWESLLVLLPKSVQVRLRPVVSNPWLLAAISLPVPLVVLVMVILGVRRKIARKRDELAGRVVSTAAEVVGAVGGSTVALDAMADVRARLRRTRERGVREWVRAWVGWWIGKLVGVWKMGTTITYL